MLDIITLITNEYQDLIQETLVLSFDKEMFIVSSVAWKLKF